MSKIVSGSVIINTYSYKTVGGSNLQAYWQDSLGKRYSAQVATEVGGTSQSNEIDTLSKLLTTITVK